MTHPGGRGPWAPLDCLSEGTADFSLYVSPDSEPHGPDWALSGGFRMWCYRKPGLIPCGWCGERVPETVTGRRRRWCSDACRMKSYRAHRKGA